MKIVEMELNEAMLEFLESADDKEFTRYTFESMIDQPEVRALLETKGLFDKLYEEAKNFGLDRNIRDYMLTMVSAPDKARLGLKQALSGNPVDAWGYPIDKDDLLNDFISFYTWQETGQNYKTVLEEKEG